MALPGNVGGVHRDEGLPPFRPELVATGSGAAVAATARRPGARTVRYGAPTATRGVDRETAAAREGGPVEGPRRGAPTIRTGS